MVLDPLLANKWLTDEGGDPEFPVFEAPTRGGVTAWYSMRLTALGENSEDQFDQGPEPPWRLMTRGMRNAVRLGVIGSVELVGNSES